MRKFNLKLATKTTNAAINEYRRHYNAFMVYLALMLMADSAHAAGDVSSWFGNTQKSFTPLLSAMTGGFYIAGAFFLWSGIAKMREHGQNPQIKVSTILVDFLAGSAAIGFAYFGGGIRQQIFGGGDSGGVGGFTSFQ